MGFQNLSVVQPEGVVGYKERVFVSGQVEHLRELELDGGVVDLERSRNKNEDSSRGRRLAIDRQHVVLNCLEREGLELSLDRLGSLESLSFKSQKTLRLLLSKRIQFFYFILFYFIYFDLILIFFRRERDSYVEIDQSAPVCVKYVKVIIDKIASNSIKIHFLFFIVIVISRKCCGN